MIANTTPPITISEPSTMRSQPHHFIPPSSTGSLSAGGVVGASGSVGSVLSVGSSGISTTVSSTATKT